MSTRPYKRAAAVSYAHKWAYGRNPQYFDFHGLGGDCTNFVSQCIYAGAGVMNHTKDLGWYYRPANDRAPAWTGVEYLYNFLTKNRGPGPYGEEASLSDMEPGDFIQLSFDGVTFGHTLLVVHVDPPATERSVLIATHTFDSDNRRLESYIYNTYRCVKIRGVYTP